MKELERSNRVAMIAHGVINACMLFISVIGFVEHTVSVPVLVVLMLLGIIPVLAEFICWKRDHATKAIKHLSLIGFALFYTVLLFTAQCNMVYAFVIPMMFAVMPYHDVKAFALINVGTVVENILVVLLGATQGGFGYLGQDAGFIQISVMILLCITSIYATISNQKNTDENIESITAAQDRAEATLREVMEMSSREKNAVDTQAQTEATVPAADSATTQSSAVATAQTVTGTVDEETAQKIALEHAGVKATDATITKSKLDYEGRRQVYEIEWYAGGKKYDYEIAVDTGEILSSAYDEKTSGWSVSNSSNVTVSEADAKQTALGRVSGATQKDIYEWKFDYDDGRPEYEGKIIYGGTEYDFTIDASSGAVIEWEAESVR